MVGDAGSPMCIAHTDMNDLFQDQGQGHWSSEVPKIALFYVYLVRYFGGRTKLVGDCDSMGPSL